MGEKKICPIMSAGVSPDEDWIYCMAHECQFWQKDLGDKAKEGDGECVHVLVSTAAYSMMINQARAAMFVQAQMPKGEPQ